MGTNLKRVISDQARSRKAERISPDEWDFRSVREEELMTVLLYEYIRSCPRVRAAIGKWQEEPVDLKQLQELDFHGETKMIRSRLRRLPKATNAHAVNVAYDPSFQTDDGAAANLFLTHLKLLTSKSYFPDGGRSIALTFTNFDQPWSQLRSMRGDQYLRVRLLPAASRSGGVMGDLGPTSTYQEILALEPSVQHEGILIDWNVPLDDLTSSFREWAKRRQAFAASQTGRLPGRRAQWERLKWLAAFRIHNAGYNFAAACELISHRQLTCKVAATSGAALPIYGNSASWGKVVSKVRNAIEGNVVRWIGASFGFADFC